MSFKILLQFLQGYMLLFLAPAFYGWVNWWKARLTKRRRPLSNILQPYRDIVKYLQVPLSHAQPTSWVFRWTPYIIFIVYGSLLFTLPFLSSPLLKADLILVLYLLGLARFTISLAGLDSASSFGGLGSNREMFFHFLTEVSLFVVIISASLWSNGIYFPPQGSQDEIFPLALLCLFIAFFPVILLEARRIPVGNPKTEFELTMAGKAVEGEFSGRDVALINWAEMSKFLYLIGLWSQLFQGITNLSSHPAILILQWLIAGVGIAVWEWRSPKLRLGQVPSVAQTSLLFSLFAILLFVLRILTGGKA